jgi:hypothetical protein
MTEPERVVLTDELIAEEVAASQFRAGRGGGCCSGPEWRGHLCDYHQGYEDGLDRAQVLLGDGHDD